MKKTIKNLVIAYYSVYFAAILSAVAGIYLLKSGLKIDALSETGITLSTLLIIFIVGSVPVTLALSHFHSKKLALLENEEEKLIKYQKASIIKIVILGIGIVLGVIFFYLMNSQSMIFCAAIAALGLFLSKPNEVKIISELNLHIDDKE